MRAASSLAIVLLGCSGKSRDEEKPRELPPIDRSGSRSPEDMATIPVVSSDNLPGFQIDRRVVTWTQYDACITANHCAKVKHEGAVARVPPEAAIRFCAWRGGLLPSPSQWLKAALRSDNRIYPKAGHVADAPGVERCILADSGPSAPCFSTSKYGVSVELFTSEFVRDTQQFVIPADDGSIPNPGRLDPSDGPDSKVFDAFRCVKPQ